jgi:hypothetical protein
MPFEEKGLSDSVLGNVEHVWPIVLMVAASAVVVMRAKKNKLKEEEDQTDKQTRSCKADPIFLSACKCFKETTGMHWQLEGDRTSDFDHQVAGHTREVIRKCGSMILKPRLKSDLFLREVAFYEAARNCPPHQAHYPLPFLSQYYGTCFQVNGCDYLALDDLTRKYTTPCVMDVKMGTQTFEPDAPPEKKARELTKYSYQKEVGFRITGFKNFKKNSYSSVEKTFGRSLHPSDVGDALQTFFTTSRVRRDVLVVVVQKLDKLLRWFTVQKQHHFYCSSILIVYEVCNLLTHSRSLSLSHSLSLTHSLSHSHQYILLSQADETTGRWKESSETRPDDKASREQWSAEAMHPDDVVQVKMIDFAHTVRGDGDVDQGYIHGLRTFIGHCQSILDAHDGDQRHTFI